VDTAAITASADSLINAFTAAVAARDTNLIVSLYADDARFLPANMPRKDGRDSIRTAWVGFLMMPDLKVSIASKDKLISEAGDIVVDVGTYDLTGKDPKGKPIHDVGKYVTVLKKVNGEWKFVVDTFNSDMPMPMPGQGKS
jgi:ketosteroid isomerase-like protein